MFFFPPSPTNVFVVKQQRAINLTCSWNQNIYPPVTRFTNFTLITGECIHYYDCVLICVSLKPTSDELLHPESKRGVAENQLEGTNTTLINFFRTSNALPTDQNQYVCRAESAFGTIQDFTFLVVQGTI